MSFNKKWLAYVVIFSIAALSSNQAQAITYVTDGGGYAYAESRAATNLAPAIALSTVAIAGIIAIGVQNTHRSHSSSSSHAHSSYSDYSYGHYSSY